MIIRCDFDRANNTHIESFPNIKRPIPIENEPALKMRFLSGRERMKNELFSQTHSHGRRRDPNILILAMLEIKKILT